jgi:carbon-monoxide dehydrogenase medium subunit
LKVYQTSVIVPLVKPAPFAYSSPGSVDEAIDLLHQAGGGGRILAGGQSLAPLMNLRLAQPEHLIDLNGLGELSWIRSENGTVSIGAMTRQRQVERSPEVSTRLPVLPAALAHVGHFQIRNRGTIGGSICHADHAAELPGLLLACDGWVEARGPGGVRRIDARDLFVGPFTTILRPDEIVTAVGFPVPPGGTGWSFQEVARRRGDFAVAGAVAFLRAEGPRVESASVVVIGVDSRPLRLSGAEAILAGQEFSSETADAAAAAGAASVSPSGDIHASAETKRHLTRVLVRRALDEAFSRANGVGGQQP